MLDLIQGDYDANIIMVGRPNRRLLTRNLRWRQGHAGSVSSSHVLRRVYGTICNGIGGHAPIQNGQADHEEAMKGLDCQHCFVIVRSRTNG